MVRWVKHTPTRWLSQTEHKAQLAGNISNNNLIAYVTLRLLIVLKFVLLQH